MSTLKSYRTETIPELLYFFKYSKRALNITSQVLIGYNSNREYNRLGYFRGIFLTDVDHLKKLSYKEFSNTLLPSPYPTHCRNYGHPTEASIKTGEGIIDPGTCYDSCVENRTKKEFQTIFPGIFVFDEKAKKEPKMTHLTAYEMLKNQSWLELKETLSDQCIAVCNSPACFDTFYTPVVLSLSNFPDPAVVTYVLQSPKIETSCDPKLDTINYLTNIFSTFGFWIGLSVLSAVQVIADSIVNRIKNRIENRTRIVRNYHFRTESKQNQTSKMPSLVKREFRPTISCRNNNCRRCKLIANIHDNHIARINAPCGTLSLSSRLSKL